MEMWLSLTHSFYQCCGWTLLGYAAESLIALVVQLGYTSVRQSSDARWYSSGHTDICHATRNLHHWRKTLMVTSFLRRGGSLDVRGHILVKVHVHSCRFQGLDGDGHADFLVQVCCWMLSFGVGFDG